MDKIDSIVPGDQEFLEAAKEVIICLDEMTNLLKIEDIKIKKHKH